MKPLLLLHHRADVNTNDMWRAAIASGWSAERIDMAGRYHQPQGTTKIRYYGNTLHAHLIENHLPIKFHRIDLTVLANTRLTKRGVALMHAHEFTDDLTARCPRFIKPAENKWFPARIYSEGESPIRAQGGGTLPSDYIYVQEPLQMINEMRCFVLHGKIHTASYYRIGMEYCPLPLEFDYIPKVIHDMVGELAPHYPPGVVLDFAYTNPIEEWCFIEPNEAWASGIYGCDPVKCLEVIDASQS